VVPEQYQAIEDCFLVSFLSSVVVFMCLFSIQKSPVRYESISHSDNTYGVKVMDRMGAMGAVICGGRFPLCQYYGVPHVRVSSVSSEHHCMSGKALVRVHKSH
jgi:hypothetical protein